MKSTALFAFLVSPIILVAATAVAWLPGAIAAGVVMFAAFFILADGEG